LKPQAGANAPSGGSVSAGLGIFDTMNQIRPDVSTICIGLAASMGAFLLSAGKPGKRMSLPNSRIMIHQPLGGAQGQATDIEIQAKEILYLKQLLNQHLASHTGKPLDLIAEDTERDFFMSAEEALDIGLRSRRNPKKIATGIGRNTRWVINGNFFTGNPYELSSTLTAPARPLYY